LSKKELSNVAPASVLVWDEFRFNFWAYLLFFYRIYLLQFLNEFTNVIQLLKCTHYYFQTYLIFTIIVSNVVWTQTYLVFTFTNVVWTQQVDVFWLMSERKYPAEFQHESTQSVVCLSFTQKIFCFETRSILRWLFLWKSEVYPLNDLRLLRKITQPNLT
jgi:hypothetical protein